MRELNELERAQVRAITEQLDRAMKRDEAKQGKVDRRERSQPVEVDRRSGSDRRKGRK